MRRFTPFGLALAIVGFVVLTITSPAGASSPAQTNPCPNDPTHIEPGYEVDPPTYRVRRGDTGSEIGRECGFEWLQIADWNGIKPPYTIWDGQPLTLAAPPPPPPPVEPAPPDTTPPGPTESEVPGGPPAGREEAPPPAVEPRPAPPGAIRRMLSWPVVLGFAALLVVVAVLGRRARRAAAEQAAAASPRRRRRRAHAAPPPVSSRALLWGFGIGIVIATMMLLGLDYLSVIVAQDDLSTALGAGSVGLFWIANAYTVAYAGALVAAGLLVAHYRRTPVFVGGLVVFTVGALSAARAEALAEAIRILLGLDPGQLVGLNGTLVLSLARGVQGLGAAALVSAALDRVLVFPGERRDNALTMFSASQLIGLVLGPITGAILLETYGRPEASGWPTIFVALAGCAVVILMAVLASQGREELPREGRVDWFGAVLSMVFMAAFSYGVLDMAHHGASATALAVTSVGVVALAGFIFWEHVCKEPGYELTLLRDDERLRVACVLHAAFWASLLGTALLLGWYLLIARKFPARPPDRLLSLIAEHGIDNVPGGFDALLAGVLVLGLGVGAVPGVIVAKAMKHRSREVVAASSALMVMANLVWSRFDLTTPPRTIFGSFVICGVGLGAGMTSLLRVAMSAAPQETEGLSASERREVRRKIASIQTMFRVSGQVGGTLGVLMMATVSRFGYRIDAAAVGLEDPEQIKQAEAGLVDAAILARDSLNFDLYEAARRAYMQSMSAAMLAGAAMATLCMVVAWRSRALRDFDRQPVAAS